MEELINHAREGREELAIGLMYDTVKRHPQVLEEFEKLRLADTPLHAAAAAGRTGCTLELMIMMPSWSTKLNTSGLTPLHLALDKRHSDTALALVRRDHTLIRVKGVNGMTPLLYLAEVCTDDEDDLNVMAAFLIKCPSSINDVNNFSESAVHCIMRSPGCRAKQLVVNWLIRTRRHAVLGWYDNDGNTALHILARAADDYEEVVKMIVKLCKINVKNKDNKTPLDLAAEAGKMNVANILREGGAERGNRVVRNVESVAAYLISPSTHRETITRWLCVMIKDLTIEMRSMVLVVAALLITTAYQVALQPPGGGSNGKQPKQNVVINGNRKMRKVTMSVNGDDQYDIAANTTIIFTLSMVTVIFLLQLRIYTVPLYAGLLYLSYGYIDILFQIPESESNFAIRLMAFISCIFISTALICKCFYIFVFELKLKDKLWMWPFSNRKCKRQWRLLMSTQAEGARNSDF